MRQETSAMTTYEAQNKATMRRLFEALEANDQAALNAILAPDLVAYAHGPDPLNREAYLQEIGGWHLAFGEIHFTVEEQIAEGGKVVTRATLHAIHNCGEFLGLPPTGKQLAVSGITILRIQDSKIVETRVQSDMWGMMQQLGLVPAPQAAR
jgi:predicted ester cyclase